jgi:hypothetical protein
VQGHLESPEDPVILINAAHGVDLAESGQQFVGIGGQRGEQGVGVLRRPDSGVGSLRAGLGQRPVLAFLGATAPGDQVGGYAVQPGPRVSAGDVVTGALVEGDQERLRGDVVGQTAAQPA